MLSDVVRHRVPGSEPGIELALIEWPGAGPPALLHHANGFCAALWDPVAEQLAAHFRVFAVDARGHGDSSKPAGDEAYGWAALARDLGWVADWVLDRTGAASIGLGVGHSFGGTLTMTTAAAREGLYDRALLVDPVILPPFDSPGRELMVEGENPMAERARKRRHHWDDRAEARAFFAGKPLFESWTERALEIYVAEGLADTDNGVELKCPGRVEGAVFGGGRFLDSSAMAAKAKLPIRLARATEGNFSLDVYRALVDLLPQGDLCEIKGGHLVVMEHPDAVASAILEFIGAN